MSKPHTFHQTLEQLQGLQKILNEKFKLTQKIEELPKEVSLKEEIVFRLKENFLIANEQYQELKKFTSKNDDLNRLQEHRDKYEKEIAQVNSQRDYEQIDRAIRENLDQEQTMRNELQALERKIESFSEDFVVKENLLKAQEEELIALKEEVKVQLDSCDSDLQDIRNKEERITTHLDDKLTFRFERIIKSKGGDGIVPVRKNICNGCHMILPLQFVNEVREEEKMYHCPYCSRILYVDGESTDDYEITEIAGLQDLFEDEDIEMDDFTEEDYELFLDKDTIGSDSFNVSSEQEDSNEIDDEIDADMDDEIDADMDGEIDDDMDGDATNLDDDASINNDSIDDDDIEDDM